MTALNLSLTESQTLTAYRAFLLSVLDPAVEVVRGQDNRVPEPSVDDFVVMTPILRERLSTNVDAYADAVFTGSITVAIMTVSVIGFGTLAIGRTVFGVDVEDNTVIVNQLTGPTGGAGTYTVSVPQTVDPQKLAAGISTLLQPVKLTVQTDVHGPNSADNVQTITTAFRDNYAVEKFAESGFDVAPLYMDEARQLPFLNGEQQVEYRWSADAVMQCNPVLTIPQQFADALEVSLKDVDVYYPPTQ